MKADAVRMAMMDFQKVVEKVDSTTMQIILNGDNKLNVGSEAEIKVPLDGNVLILKDQDGISYINCDLIDIIEIWN